MAARRESAIRWLGHRTARSPGVGVVAALEGAALIMWNLVATPFIGRRRLRWGTAGTETPPPDRAASGDISPQDVSLEEASIPE